MHAVRRRETGGAEDHIEIAVAIEIAQRHTERVVRRAGFDIVAGAEGSAAVAQVEAVHTVVGDDQVEITIAVEISE